MPLPGSYEKGPCMASRTSRRKKAARTISRAMNKVAGRRAIQSEEFRTNLRKVMRKKIDTEFEEVTPEERKRFQKQYTLAGLAGQVGRRKARGDWTFVREGLWRDPRGKFRKDVSFRRSRAMSVYWEKMRMLAEASELPVSQVRKAWKELGPDAEEIIKEVAGGVYPETKQAA